MTGQRRATPWWAAVWCAVALVWAAVARAQDAPFDVMAFDIEGNTVLPVTTLEEAVTPFLGPAGGMAKVEAARAALERAYQQAGYLTVFVDVPEQQVNDGVVRLLVLQGRVDRLRVVGSRWFDHGRIRETVPELAEGGTPNFSIVQRQLAELNRTEDRSVQPVLRPGRLPGTVEIDLQVKDRLPAGASLELNNRHQAATPAWRLSAGAHYDNLWQRGHALSLTLTTAPEQPSATRLAVLNYSVPMPDDATLALYAVSSNSLNEPLSSVTVAGKGFTLGLRWVRPLPPVGNLTHALTLGFDFKDFDTRIDTRSGGDASADSAVLTPLRYGPLQLGWNAQWQEGGVGTSLSTQIVAAQHRLFARRLDCVGLPDDQFNCSAQGTDGSFAYLRAELRHSRPLPGWGALAFKLGGQFSTEPLVGNERFSLGGADSVRGYPEAEASGDRALLAGVEWRSPNLGGAKGLLPGAAWLDELLAYGFAEAGQVNVLNAQAGQAAHVQLKSAGLGLQWRAGRSANGALDLAWPLVDSANTRVGTPRVHLRLAYSL